MNRHVVRVRISGFYLLDILKSSRPRCISCEGIPSDAQFLRFAHDVVSDTFFAFFEHPSFPECPEGCIPEEVSPQFSEYFDPGIEEIVERIQQGRQAPDRSLVQL